MEEKPIMKMTEFNKIFIWVQEIVQKHVHVRSDRQWMSILKKKTLESSNYLIFLFMGHSCSFFIIL